MFEMPQHCLHCETVVNIVLSASKRSLFSLCCVVVNEKLLKCTVMVFGIMKS